MKVDVSQERPSFAKFNGLLCNPHPQPPPPPPHPPFNGQNSLSWPETFCRRPLTQFCTSALSVTRRRIKKNNKLQVVSWNLY